MSIIAGLDIGGSTTKIVLVRDGNVLSRELVVATDPVTSAFGAVGKMLNTNQLPLSEITRIQVTGVGAAFIHDDVLGIPTCSVPEFHAIGRGGLSLSGLDRAIVVSIGTGTAIVLADSARIQHVIGSGIGGGTLLGLSSAMLNVREFGNILQLADEGKLGHVDLWIRDITSAEIPGLKPETTASNFGKLEDNATREDMALGLINMVFQSIGTMAVLSARLHGVRDIVCTGSMTQARQSREVFGEMASLYDMRFHVPDDAEFATAMGAALYTAYGTDEE